MTVGPALRGLGAAILAILLLPIGGTLLAPFLHPDGMTFRAELPRVVSLLRTTSVIAAGGALFAVPVGFLLALHLVRRRPWWSGAAWGFLLTLLLLPLSLQASGWVSAFGPSGMFPIACFQDRAGPMALWIVTFIHAVAALPWTAAIFALDLQSRSPSAEEEGLLSAGWGKVIALLLAPSMKRSILLAIVLAAVPVFTDMSICDLFAVRSLAEEAYLQVDLVGGDERLTFLSLLLAGFASVVLAAMLRPIIVPSARIETNSRLDVVGMSQTTTARLVGTVACLAVGMMAIPFVGIGWQLGWESSGSGGSWSFANVFDALSSTIRLHGAMTLQSLIWSAIAGSLATISAAILAWCWVALGPISRFVGLVLALTFILLPAPIVGLALVDFCQLPDPTGLLAMIYDGPAIIILGQSLRVTPWLFLYFSLLLGREEPALWENLRVEGYGPLRLFAVALWGVHRSAVGVAFLFGTAMAAGELPVTKIIAPPGHDTLAVLIFSLLHVGTTRQLAALATTMSLMILCLAAAALGVARFRRRN